MAAMSRTTHDESDLRKKPASGNDQTAELEARVAELEQQVVALDQRVTALESDGGVVEPPVEPPTEPPTHVPGQPDIIKDGKTLAQLVANGGTVILPPGKFWGTARISKPTELIGDADGTTLTAEGLTCTDGKGLFVASASFTVRDITLCDAKVPSANGASVRVDAGIPLTMRNVEVFGCEMGILGSGNSVLIIEDCNFHDNGQSSGNGHEIYTGHYGGTLTITDSDIISSELTTHAVKSRCAETTIRNSDIVGSTDTTGTHGGAVIDICDGGTVLIESSKISTSPDAANSNLLRYAQEGNSQGVRTVTLRDVTVVDQAVQDSGGVISSGRSGATLIIEDCRYEGDKPPQLQGWSTVQGRFEAAS